MPRKRREHVPELQWLEDGINFLVSHTIRCTKVLALGLMQLYRQWRS
jgi:hypothetical protein